MKNKMCEEKRSIGYKEFKEALPEWKRKKDPPLSRIFYRPLSFGMAALFTKFGIGANTVSNISTVIGVIACIFFAIPFYWSGIVGAVLVNLWLILDCTDGNIARTIKKQPFGEFVDAVSGYILTGLMFNILGARVYLFGGILNISPVVIMVLGGLASSFDSLMRLVYQKYVVISREENMDGKVQPDGSNASFIDKVRIKIDQNLNLGGILPLAVLLASIFNALDLVILFWVLYYGAVFAATTVYLVRKTIKLQK